MQSLNPIPDTIREALELAVAFYPEELASLLCCEHEEVEALEGEIGEAQRVIDECLQDKRCGHPPIVRENSAKLIEFRDMMQNVAKELNRTARAKRDAAKASRALVAQAAE